MMKTFLFLLSTALLAHAQQLDLGATTAPVLATAPPQTFATATIPPNTATVPPVTQTVPPNLATTAPVIPQATIPPQTTAAPVNGEEEAEEDGWTGCVDPRRSAEDNLVRLGEPTTICIVLASSTTWNVLTPSTYYLRLSFQPRADEYSRFHVPSSYQDLIVQEALPRLHDGNNNVTIHVSSGKVLSFQRIFYTPNAGAGRIYPYLTAIIDVQKGVVKGITWDDGCLFCSDDKCDENTYDFNGNMGTQKEYGQPTRGCHIPQTECTTAMVVSAGSNDAKPICDISVYVVWTGDDANGKAFQSSAFRFSAFPEQEIKNRITDNLPDIPTGSLGGLFGGGDANGEQNGA